MSLKLEERLERGASLLECSHSFVFNSEGNSKIPNSNRGKEKEILKFSPT
jgi:hypothetical protein